jgi:hypothetical protein
MAYFLSRQGNRVAVCCLLLKNNTYQQFMLTWVH